MPDLPNPLTLSEEEWFAIDWPLADLRAQYADSRFDEIRREHAFWRYWSDWLKVSGSELVPRSTLEEIIAPKEWQSPFGEVIATLVRDGRVELADAAWVLNALPPKTWAHDQVLAFLLLADSSVDWVEKLHKLLELRADWAVQTQIKSLPPDTFAEAKRIIEESSRPKKTRRFLLDELNRRADKL